MTVLTDEQIERLRHGTASDVVYVATEFVESVNPDMSDYSLSLLESCLGVVLGMLQSQESFMKRNKDMFFRKEVSIDSR